MPRPRKLRFVRGGPMSNAFKPKGIPARDLEEVVLSVEGLEALRLTDLEKQDQETAATQMNVSRQTFGRVLAEARQVVAEALVMGKVIRIQGGFFTLSGVDRRGRLGRRRRPSRSRDSRFPRLDLPIQITGTTTYRLWAVSMGHGGVAIRSPRFPMRSVRSVA